MKIRKYELLLDGLTNDILDELLHTSDVLQHVLIRLPKLALNKDLREEPLAHRQRLSRGHVAVALWIARGAIAMRVRAGVAAGRGAVRVEVVEHAEVHAAAALVRDCELAGEDESGHGELDRERHE